MRRNLNLSFLAPSPSYFSIVSYFGVFFLSYTFLSLFLFPSPLPSFLPFLLFASLSNIFSIIHMTLSSPRIPSSPPCKSPCLLATVAQPPFRSLGQLDRTTFFAFSPVAVGEQHILKPLPAQVRTPAKAVALTTTNTTTTTITITTTKAITTSTRRQTQPSQGATPFFPRHPCGREREGISSLCLLPLFHCPPPRPSPFPCAVLSSGLRFPFLGRWYKSAGFRLPDSAHFSKLEGIQLRQCPILRSCCLPHSLFLDSLSTFLPSYLPFPFSFPNS